MFSRYPKWSESYPYTLTREVGIAYWTNLASIFARTAAKLSKDLTLALDYHHLFAAQPGATDWTSGGGRDRGNLFIGRLTYKASAHLSGHVVWETFEPGDYFFSGADHSSWMRMEAQLTY